MSLDPTLDPRLAGTLRRYHAWPILRDQSVAEHSWQVVRLLLAIHPSCEKRAIVQALLHDVGEWGGPGDVPFGAKRRSPALATAARRLENDSHLSMSIPWSLPAPADLEPVDSWAVKIADLLEMWEKGREEVLMGNKFAMMIVEHTESAVLELSKQRPAAPAEPWSQIAHNLKNYMQRRMITWQVK